MAQVAAPQSIICKGCWDQMKMPIPIRGPLSFPLRLFGVTQSKMNPNICTICERAFRAVKKGSHFSETATILFVDIRGYTQLSEAIDPVELTEIVRDFQDQCAQGIWARDGIVNKQMGDGLMAIFNFPIRAGNHARQAVEAALEIQDRCKRSLARFPARLSLPEHELGVGIGIHTGTVEIGEFSSARSDFTAIGGVVNTSARLESAARAGEIVLSPETAKMAGDIARNGTHRTLELKGIKVPVEAIVLGT
jgi:adenylate cyclase